MNMQDEWNRYEKDFKKQNKQHADFMIWIRNNNILQISENENKWNFDKFSLTSYTSLLDKNNPDIAYFTNWLEKKTRDCGAYATSSLGYGIYRRKPTEKDIDQNIVAYRSRGKDGDLSTGDRDQIWLNVRGVLTTVANLGEIASTRPLDPNFCRKIAYMFNPDKLLPIFNSSTIRVIADYFEVENCDEMHYLATQVILNHFKNKTETENSQLFKSTETLDFNFTQRLGNFLYSTFGDPLIVEDNTIFYGPPGTGKTYGVDKGLKSFFKSLPPTQKEYAREPENKVIGQIEYVQFHPGYTYEDFIEGLRPVLPKDSSNISIEVQSGKFKLFCKKAAEALQVARNKKVKDSEIPRYFFIADEINRADLSRVFGDSLVCLERTKRFDYDTNGHITEDSFHIKTTLSHMDKKENAVIRIDDENYFGIPSNVYFIGTMNDTDRSIDAFDLALRRRFIWKRTGCDYGVIKNSLESKYNLNISPVVVENYATRCEKLNNLISEKWNFGDSYELGHAYFMLPPRMKFSNNFQESTFDNRLAPLIKEYLRSDYSEKDIKQKIKEAKNIFMMDNAEMPDEDA